MADITDSEAIKFCNEEVRPAADKLAQAYKFVKTVVDKWNANSMSTKIPDNAADDIIDGSATDGRHPLTGEDVNLLVTRCQELITDYEATSNAKLNTIIKVAVNPRP